MNHEKQKIYNESNVLCGIGHGGHNSSGAAVCLWTARLLGCICSKALPWHSP